MEINLFFLFILVIIMTIRAYFMMISDKRKAMKGRWRTSEMQLFQVAFLLGSPGIWLGMLPPVNHKKSKISFILMITLITAVQVFLAIYAGYAHTENFYFKIPF